MYPLPAESSAPPASPNSTACSSSCSSTCARRVKYALSSPFESRRLPRPWSPPLLQKPHLLERRSHLLALQVAEALHRAAAAAAAVVPRAAAAERDDGRVALQGDSAVVVAVAERRPWAATCRLVASLRTAFQGAASPDAAFRDAACHAGSLRIERRAHSA